MEPVCGLDVRFREVYSFSPNRPREYIRPQLGLNFKLLLSLDHMHVGRNLIRGDPSSMSNVLTSTSIVFFHLQHLPTQIEFCSQNNVNVVNFYCLDTFVSVSYS